MTTCTRPAANSTPEQLRFPLAVGFTVRADFTGGKISSDLGALLLSAVDRRIGLIDRLTAAINDSRHASYIKHSGSRPHRRCYLWPASTFFLQRPLWPRLLPAFARV